MESSTDSTTSPTPPTLTAASTASRTTTPIPVRVISPAEYKPAAYALAEAFATDAVARYFLDTPDRTHWTPAQKWTLHLRIIEYITRAHALRGAVTTAGPNYASVALWMPPGAHTDGLSVALRSGLWRLRYQLSREGRARFFDEFLPLLHDTKAAVLGPARDADSWYLVYLGTRPAARGRGFARANVEWGMARADAGARPVYLESSSVANLPLYRRLGFEVVERIELVRAVGGGRGAAALVERDAAPAGEGGDGKVVMDIMVREPVDKSKGGATVMQMQSSAKM